MGKTERRLIELSKNENLICCEKGSLENFEKSAKEFQMLIDSGLAKSRGYNLATIEDSGCDTFAFNVSE